MGKLKEKMVNEMRLRNLSPKTITAYLARMKNFVKYYKKPPDQITLEEIKNYQLFLIDNKKVSWNFFNHTVCALRFFYNKVLKKNGELKSCITKRKVLYYPPY